MEGAGVEGAVGLDVPEEQRVAWEREGERRESERAREWERENYKEVSERGVGEREKGERGSARPPALPRGPHCARTGEAGGRGCALGGQHRGRAAVGWGGW